jgi:predicted GTPase
MKVNHGMISDSQKPSPVVMDPFVLGIKTLQDHRVVLLDTPGFDDTLKDDTTILQVITDWLAQSSVISNFSHSRRLLIFC